jgi:hypothetical protein
MDSEIKQMCQHKITTVMLGGLSVLVDPALGEFAQDLIGLLFFGERIIEKLQRLVQAQLAGRRLQRPVTGGLIMFDRLGGCEQTRVERWLALKFLRLNLSNRGGSTIGLRVRCSSTPRQCRGR